MKSQATIELNGKRYDATSGVVLGVASAPPIGAARNIDGFFRSRSTKTASKAPPIADGITLLAAPVPMPKPPKPAGRTTSPITSHTSQPISIKTESIPPENQKGTPRHSSINHTKPHITQRSRTLRREGVKPPAASLLRRVGTKGVLQHKVPALIVSKTSVAGVDNSRLHRAQSTPRSPQVGHYGSEAKTIKPAFMPLAVKPIPVKPEAQEPRKMPAPLSPPRPTDIFEHALANANHFVDLHARKVHLQKKTRQHVLSIAAGTLALLVIAGFAAYQNTPGLQFKVASVRAGVATAMPNFKAAGFAYNGVRSGDGKLTVGFQNNSGNYQLVQQSTNLSSADMIEDIGSTDASGTPNYHTIHAGNTTIYRFNNTNATWISGGKWYTVTGTGALSDTQVKALATNS